MNNIIEMPNMQDDNHNPLACSLNMEHNVRYNTALGQISQTFNEFNLCYLDFCNIMMALDHYYHNWAEINEVDIEDEDFACGATLPSMLEPWCFHDFDDEDE